MRICDCCGGGNEIETFVLDRRLGRINRDYSCDYHLELCTPCSDQLRFVIKEFTMNRSKSVLSGETEHKQEEDPEDIDMAIWDPTTFYKKSVWIDAQKQLIEKIGLDCYLVGVKTTILRKAGRDDFQFPLDENVTRFPKDG